MITEQAIKKILIQTPKSVKLNNKIIIEVVVLGSNGKPMDAVVPVKINIMDPQGNVADLSGYYGAKDGRVKIVFMLAPNDLSGEWTIQVKELASGRTSQHKFIVNKEV